MRKILSFGYLTNQPDCVARSKQVYIDRLEATILLLSYLDVTSVLKSTMPVQAVAVRGHARHRHLGTTKASVGASRQL
jgi:hypothetical protein